MSFKQDIKKMRLEKNMTQQELADYVHVSRQTVSTWETGKNYPSLDVLRLLSVLFDVSFEKIIFGEEVKMSGEQKSIAATIDQAVSLKSRYKKISVVFGTAFLLLVAWIFTLTIGYQKGIGIIDRFNPFLQYKVSYTQLPTEKIIRPRDSKNSSYWTRWFSDNEMGTEWSKLTLTTGLNPGVQNPYVMAYHKGSYVKIARIVPGSSVNAVMKSNISAINSIMYTKSRSNVMTNVSAVKELKHKKHFTATIQEMVVQ
ncbi:hypothetical protein GCM10025879_08170 [Leuconostoc litchii]|uniref:XRE family transcriptional regulator n=1 Tax=Leuconostoc litchii TaxID=1981069 RepID=A0A6P2CNN9_9LACO|nr:helix-turn-helix transcriptional regulator [Leuconostoc litchii]TYC47540.1 XRE family transcriptional regulator [Leuconostoc litchii]GMA69571.1 hypothetical protein GCM10025879_08170 [Leuconostoc litchii]